MPDRAGCSVEDAGPALGVVIGFDFGTKNIGLAIGQEITDTAAPLCTIRLGDAGEPWKTISQVVATWAPALFVVGMPYRADGEENPVAEDTRRFCRHLQKRFRLPVYTVDETLSTSESRSRFFAERRHRRTAFVRVKDELAAQVILQTWFDQRERFPEARTCRDSDG